MALVGALRWVLRARGVVVDCDETRNTLTAVGAHLLRSRVAAREASPACAMRRPRLWLRLRLRDGPPRHSRVARPLVTPPSVARSLAPSAAAPPQASLGARLGARLATLALASCKFPPHAEWTKRPFPFFFRRSRRRAPSRRPPRPPPRGRAPSRARDRGKPRARPSASPASSLSRRASSFADAPTTTAPRAASGPSPSALSDLMRGAARRGRDPAPDRAGPSSTRGAGRSRPRRPARRRERGPDAARRDARRGGGRAKPSTNGSRGGAVGVPAKSPPRPRVRAVAARGQENSSASSSGYGYGASSAPSAAERDALARAEDAAPWCARAARAKEEHARLPPSSTTSSAARPRRATWSTRVRAAETAPRTPPGSPRVSARAPRGARGARPRPQRAAQRFETARARV